MENIQCNICGSKKQFKIFEDLKRKNTLTIVMCEDCSLVYINPRISENDYKKLYKIDYQADRHGVFDYNQAIERLHKKGSYENKKTSLKNFLNYINKNSHVLDIGAGWGTLLRAIKDRFGCDVTGIETSEIASSVGRQHYGLNIHNQTLEDYLSSDDVHVKFDFIILNHVLEHFMDPYSRLLDIKKKLLSTRGFLYVAVPNIANPDESLDRFFHIEHCYYFSPMTINQLFQKAGFKIVNMDIDKNEARYIVSDSASSLKAIDTSNFSVLYSKENIIKVLKSHDIKYKVLRVFKNIAYIFLNRKYQNKVSRVSSNILRKFRIIRI